MERNKILVVDDDERNRRELSGVFVGKYQILEAENGSRALQFLRKYAGEIEAVLLEWLLPGLSGNGVLKEMEKNGWLSTIPVLVQTSDPSIEIEKEAFELGASDFIRRPSYPEVLKTRVAHAVALAHYSDDVKENVEEQTEIVRKQYKVMKYQAEKLKDVNQKVLDIIMNVVSCDDPESSEGIYTVKEVTRLIAEKVQKLYPEYNLTDQDVEAITAVSSLRDIGKLMISDYVLFKPAKLTKEEFEYMKSHTGKGCEIVKLLADVQSKDYQKKSMEICRYHHERYDGKGYPDGLKGDEIPISAQIVSIADAYNGLISESLYKRAYSRKDACYMILRGDCGVFSPKILECFRLSWDAIEKLEG